jgi:sugar porter (SP) family MFS transporter
VCEAGADGRLSAMAEQDKGIRFLREVIGGSNRLVLALAAIAALGGFLFGYDTGIISGALLFIKRDLDATTFEQQAIVGSLLLGAVLGAMLSGYAADAFSRRWTKVISGCVYVLAAIASALSQQAWELIGSRFVLGIAVGTASFVSPMYISELAPPRIRGGLTSFNQLMIVSGILGAYIASFLLKDVGNEWRWMLALGAVPGLGLAIGMTFAPHSPRWLVQQGREDEARDVLKRTRREGEVDDELREIGEAAKQEGGIRDVFSRAARPLVAVGLALAIFQQLIGVNTVIYYAPTILSFTGLDAGSAITQTVFIGVTNVVFTLIAVVFLDRIGRRVFLLIGTAGCTISLVLLGVFFASDSLQENASWIALIALITYIGSFAVGLGPVFWLMISEIFPLRMRAPAMATCTVANWGFNFLISVTFLSLVQAISKPGTFWLYAGFGVIAFALFAVKVPETRSRSLEEIEAELGADEPAMAGSSS